MDNGNLKIVVKVEINTLLNEHNSLNEQAMERMTMILSNLSNSGSELFIVSSGAIFLGAKKLGVSVSPGTLIDKQALSAIGQAELMNRYRSYFETYNLTIAQVLLTADVFTDPERRKNARNTISHLTEMNVIPVINENDAVSTEDIELNDNYYLVRNVAELMEAHMILIKGESNGDYAIVTRRNRGITEKLHENMLIGQINKQKPGIFDSKYLAERFPDRLLTEEKRDQ